MKTLCLLVLMIFITACDKEMDPQNARTFYQTCKESRSVDFSSVTSQSTCNGINLILAMYLSQDISTDGINYILFSVFKTNKGKIDWKAIENFREPVSGKTLGHIMAEYGGYSEIEELFKRYDKSELFYLRDRSGENIFHKLALNPISSIYLEKYCSEVPALRALMDQKNTFGLTPLELVASQRDFSKTLNFYGCHRKRQSMAALFAEYGMELSFSRQVVNYPELFDYMVPFLAGEREVAINSGANVQRLSLFELHKFSPAFGRFIMLDHEIYERFMSDSEIMLRMVDARVPENYGNRDVYGQNTFYYYASSKLDDRSLLKEIMKKTDFQNVNLRGETIYHVLAKNDRRKELKMALKKLENKNLLLLKNLDGKTALDICVGETCKILKKVTPVL